MNSGELAQAFEDAIGHLWDGTSANSRGKPISSCDAICGVSPPAGVLVRTKCLSYIEYIGVTAPDYICSTTEKRQLHRALRLTLLAEMAEQGDLTSEGLKPDNERIHTVNARKDFRLHNFSTLDQKLIKAAIAAGHDAFLLSTGGSVPVLLSCGTADHFLSESAHSTHAIYSSRDLCPEVFFS